MPYRSAAQRRKFHALLSRGEISPRVVKEYDRASKGMRLPERVLHDPKKERAMSEPKVYLSRSAGKYRVIQQGMPISGDKSSAAEALAVADHFKLKVSDKMWDGDVGDWRPLSSRDATRRKTTMATRRGLKRRVTTRRRRRDPEAAAAPAAPVATATSRHRRKPAAKRRRPAKKKFSLRDFLGLGTPARSKTRKRKAPKRKAPKKRAARRDWFGEPRRHATAARKGHAKKKRASRKAPKRRPAARRRGR